MSKLYTGLTGFDSDSEDELFEAAFLAKAKIKSSTPLTYTHGVQINPKKDKIIQQNFKVISVPTDVKVSNFEADALRFKVKNSENIIQIVENKSLLGKKKPGAEWVAEHVTPKIENIIALKEFIQQYGSEAVDIFLTQEKQTAAHQKKQRKKESPLSVQGMDKIRYIEMFLSCNAIKYRFAAEEKDVSEEFVQEFVKKIKEYKDYRITYRFGCRDSASDELHFQARSIKYSQKTTTDSKSLLPSIAQKRSIVKSQEPIAAKLEKEIDEVNYILSNLEKDIYPSTATDVTLILDEKNIKDAKKMRSFLTSYHKIKDQAFTKYKGLDVMIKETITTLGYTAAYQYEIANDSKGNPIGIKVITKISKFSLIQEYEKILKQKSEELNKLSKPSSQTPSRFPGRNPSTQLKASTIPQSFVNNLSNDVNISSQPSSLIVIPS